MTIKTKYIDYEIQDFLKDEFFVKWATNSDPKLSDFWDKWISEHPQKTNTILEAKQLIQSLQYKEEAHLVDDEYIRLYEKILKGHNITGSTKKRYTNFYRVAAAVSLIVVSFFTLNSYYKKLNNYYKKEKEERANYEVKSAANGEKLTFRLSDGTIVKLNAGSQLEFQEVLGDQIREVRLTGEAFFDVVKDVHRSFVVKTDKMKVETLGTSFNVNSYNEEGNHTITLVTGKVGVSTLDKSNYKILVPGQRAHVNKDAEIIISEVDLTEVNHWRYDILSFDENDFDEVIVSLERWYGVKVTIEGTIPTLDRFSGKFKNESLENILDVIAFASGFTYTVNEKNVNIKF